MTNPLLTVQVDALRDGASALSYRAERLSGVAGQWEDPDVQEAIASFRRNADILTDMAEQVQS
jgi:L-arabinose isomerase